MVSASDLVKQSKAAKSSRETGQPLDTRSLLFDLANTNDDGIRAFRRKWDRLYRRYGDQKLLKYRDELRLLWGHATPPDEEEFRDQFVATSWEDFTSGMTERQKQLFKAYLDAPASPEHNSLEKMICEMWLNEKRDGSVVDWTPTRKRIRANPVALPVVLAWACVHDAEHLGFCRNPACANPYFIAKRKDQRYCSPECAQPAKKEAKLKWWHRNRGSMPKRGRSTRKAKSTKGGIDGTVQVPRQKDVVV